MITGAGETRSTPDIVVNMMDLDPTMTNPKPATYLAIADGERQLNKAKVVKFGLNRHSIYVIYSILVCRPL